MVRKNILLGIVLCSGLFFSCTKYDLDNPGVIVSLSSQNVKVGEPVEFVIEHNALVGSIYTGDNGHNYSLSADYLLAGKSEEDIKNNVYRPAIPGVEKFVCDLSEANIGDDVICDGKMDYVNFNDGSSLMNNDAEIVMDIETQKPVLSVNLQHPEIWDRGLKLNVNTKFGDDKFLTIRMKHEFPYLVDLTTKEPVLEASKMTVVITLSGYGLGDEEPTYDGSTDWSISVAPNIEYQDFKVDLSRVIEAWEKGTGKKLDKIDHIRVLFVASDNKGYIGHYYIEQVTFGNFAYYPFDTGVSLNISDNSGIIKYNYIYNEPGEYEAVIIGANISWKKYSGDGYIYVRGENINANEYDYCNQYVRIPITVTE